VAMDLGHAPIQGAVELLNQDGMLPALKNGRRLRNQGQRVATQ